MPSATNRIETAKPVGPGWTLVGLGVLASAGAALLNRRAAHLAEQETPPVGSFLEVAGTRLHYLRRGSGSAVVLIHGNGAMVQDWIVSSVFGELANTNDVTAFDRPGCGFSERPGGTVWTPAAQAELIVQAMRQLGIERACVVGHSFGATVAAALAVNHPEVVERLVLMSGFYYPAPRLDAAISGVAALPVIGDVLRYTISPLIGRAMKPMTSKTLFSPAPVSHAWSEVFPFAMAVRPSQLHATAADGALMLQGAAELEPRYGELNMPVTIVTGDGDKIVDPETQSIRLHRELPQSRLVMVAGAGHMVHHIAPSRVLKAIRSEVDLG